MYLQNECTNVLSLRIENLAELCYKSEFTKSTAYDAHSEVNLSANQ